MVFCCILCGNCQEICLVGICLKDFWILLCQDLVYFDYFFKKIEMICNNLVESYNVFVEDNQECVDWVEDMDDVFKDGYICVKVDVVYFMGCVVVYFFLVQNILVVLVEILEVGGVNFILLGEDEWCCGFFLLGVGLKELYWEFVEYNFSVVCVRGVKIVIFVCFFCYQMWWEFYFYEIEIVYVF